MRLGCRGQEGEAAEEGEIGWRRVGLADRMEEGRREREGATGDQLESSDGAGQEVEDGSEDGGGCVWRGGRRRLGRGRAAALAQGPEQGDR